MSKSKLMLCVFKKNQTKEIAKLLGFDLRKTRCAICGKKLNSENIGHFVHYRGKKAVLCTKVFPCWQQFIMEEKPEIFGLDKYTKKPLTHKNENKKGGKK